MHVRAYTSAVHMREYMYEYMYNTPVTDTRETMLTSVVIYNR